LPIQTIDLTPPQDLENLNPQYRAMTSETEPAAVLNITPHSSFDFAKAFEIGLQITKEEIHIS
jgi:hypothetical protein